MPLSVILKDIVNVANTTREVKRALHLKEVLVNQKRSKNHRQPVGVMDTIHIKDAKKSFRISIDAAGRICAVKIDDKEAAKKVSRIIGKTKQSKGKTQLNFEDARNILVDKDEYKVGDSVVLDLPSQKITEHLKLQEGATIILTGGKHKGVRGKILNLHEDKVLFQSKDTKYTTLKKYSLVIGKDKPVVTVA